MAARVVAAVAALMPARVPARWHEEIYGGGDAAGEQERHKGSAKSERWS